MTRKALPHRRPNDTSEAIWHNHAITVTVGYDPATGQAREVFAQAGKGGDMQATVADACVLISIALQHGISPDELRKSLSTEPDYRGGTNPASPIGAILAVL